MADSRLSDKIENIISEAKGHITHNAHATRIFVVGGPTQAPRESKIFQVRFDTIQHAEAFKDSVGKVLPEDAEIAIFVDEVGKPPTEILEYVVSFDP
jgi:hypothetical protein